MVRERHGAESQFRRPLDNTLRRIRAIGVVGMQVEVDVPIAFFLRGPWRFDGNNGLCLPYS